MPRHDLLVVGRLARPHSLRGEIRVDYRADSLQLLEKPLWLRAGAEEALPVRLLSWKLWRHAVVILLEGVATRTQAECLRGRELLISAADLPPPDETEPYVRDLLGMSVLLPGGESAGLLENVFFTRGGADGQEVWSIRAPAGHEILFPAVPAFVEAIDRKNGVIRILPPSGLLEIYAPAAPPDS